ncbi:TNF receptor-associated factor 2 isoform X2 [Tupaia chinensis]|uniref:TNF receptor-associated factor 2 isoform X2 n=1 Tax=Tupaia chinensis TaxID=246437 RepID=UPI000703F77E|nr:TNF receptor-associated factor 2 isoform X2 [Tupaia chinensis]
MAAAGVTPPGSRDLLQPGFSKVLLGTKPEAKYLCSACGNILRRPLQAQCGHRYCSSCLAGILSSGPQNCAACVHEGIYEDDISILDSSSAFPDNAARREVESLPAACASDGCTWKGTLKEYESCHEGHCPFALTECPACEGLVRLSERERHTEQECPERSRSCPHCQAPCCGAALKVHHDVCPKFPLSCDSCGQRDILRETFQDHIRTCGRRRVPCRFQALGCSELVEGEGQPEHEAQWLQEHLGLLLRWALEVGPPAREPGQPEPELLQRCESLEGKTATFENIVCVLNREVERVAVTAAACSRQHRLDQDKIEALSNKVQQLERHIGLKDLAVADLERRVLELEACSYFFLKISYSARKRHEAVAGRTPAIFSPGHSARGLPGSGDGVQAHGRQAPTWTSWLGPPRTGQWTLARNWVLPLATQSCRAPATMLSPGTTLLLTVLLAASSQGQRARRPPMPPSPISTIQPKANFDARQFAGTWFLVAVGSACRFLQEQAHRAEATALHVTPQGETMAVSNFRKLDGICWQVRQLYADTGVPGRFLLQARGARGAVHVVVAETDYRDFAIVFLERARQLSVKLYARSLPVSDPVLATFEQHVQGANLTEDQVVFFPKYGFCEEASADQFHTLDEVRT